MHHGVHSLVYKILKNTQKYSKYKVYAYNVNASKCG